ncbi:MAG: DHH family phosphoesterase [Candidatus Pacebacteria bacterium]|jgi:single-stranded-DNA-specific exonuclease|nr:DHH family phosphoesterase [Candidatus Paceibacterota bacterium]MDD2796613.1 DHH family phosphoesterase [Candidatus Paceibacterota bacterium]MDD3509982.1 DHH family phosphoesterase [Candidatus Paceibacterota bacterium]MDD3918583.1 DHH family phosphoesterase [Candidatus Paceibacterota bacterium]MDD4664703.1 DHH family phosphoesterase [Candidatus Paceibacterota bacterium]
MKKIRNIEKASNRIKKAILENEQIVLFGDSDMDGIASVVILEETITNLASILKKKIHKIITAFPDRRKDGYGLNERVLIFLNKKRENKKSLLILLDCGITNVKEIAKAKDLGFDIIIVDHHKVLNEIPKADIIVNTKHPKDSYYFKDYANAGLTFKLAEEILQANMSSFLRNDFVELVMLATIADMMKEEDENQKWIYEGLSNIENTKRPAFVASIELAKPFNSTRELVNKILAIFKTTKMKNHKIITYDFVKSNSIEEAKAMAKELLKESENRQAEVRALTENLKEELKLDQSSIIFKGSKDYRPDFLGAVASRLVGYFDKPVFLYSQKKETSRGTVRVPKDVDAVKAMDSCKDLLIMYGGHPPAAGFTVENSKLKEFEACLIKYFSK